LKKIFQSHWFPKVSNFIPDFKLAGGEKSAEKPVIHCAGSDPTEQTDIILGRCRISIYFYRRAILQISVANYPRHMRRQVNISHTKNIKEIKQDGRRYFRTAMG
jgi:hypothetical protein